MQKQTLTDESLHPSLLSDSVESPEEVKGEVIAAPPPPPSSYFRGGTAVVLVTVVAASLCRFPPLKSQVLKYFFVVFATFQYFLF